MYQFRQKQSP